MIRAGAGIATAENAVRALEEAAEAALGASGRPESALLFATLEPGASAPALLDAAVGCLGTEAIVGASVHGVLGAGLEHTGEVSVSVLTLAGLEAQPFLLHDLRENEAEAGADIAAQLGGRPGPRIWSSCCPTRGPSILARSSLGFAPN